MASDAAVVLVAAYTQIDVDVRLICLSAYKVAGLLDGVVSCLENSTVLEIYDHA